MCSGVMKEFGKQWKCTSVGGDYTFNKNIRDCEGDKNICQSFKKIYPKKIYILNLNKPLKF